MCGIYGSIAATANPTQAQASQIAPFDSSLEVEHQALARLKHRGPDHLGWFVEPGIFLGHARLSILDPAPSAHQPFHEGDAVLLTNGEVYNFKELAQALPGEFWRSHSDTEVIMRYLRLHGEAALRLFNGMFALAFWDTVNRKFLLARDRVGIKPLYYSFDGQKLRFASEMKALAAPVNPATLSEVLTFGHFEAGCLPFQGVQELPPGYLLRYVPGQLPEVAPWLGDSEKPVYPMAQRVQAECFRQAAGQSLDAAAKALQTHLEKSVALHLRSDAPLGALCSGGLDSSLIAAMAQKHRPDLALYHCGSAEGGGEEKYARQVADHLKLPLNLVSMSRVEYWRLFPQVTWHLEMPIYHPNDISLYLVAQKAKQDGIKVLLAGEGADELFGGYAWHRHFAEQLKAQGRIAGLMKWRNRGEALLRKVAGRAHASAESLAASAPYGPGYPGSSEFEVVQGAGLASQGGRAFARWQALRQVYRELANPIEAETLAFMLEDLHGHLGTILHRTDRVLMGLGIEGRVPFLENEIMDFALNLPLAQKIGNKGGKHLLKRVAEGFLPQEIVYRRKVGFPVPWQGYLPATVPQVLRRGFVCEWLGWNASTLEAAYKLSPTSAFRLLAIEVFGRLFAQGVSPDSLEIL